MKQLSSLDFSGVARIKNLPSPLENGDAVSKQYFQENVNGSFKDFIYQKSIKNIQVDNTLDASTPATGDRYILTNILSLHASFGTIEGVSNNDVVEYDGIAFNIVFSPAAGIEGLVFNHGDNKWYSYIVDGWEQIIPTFSNGIFKMEDGTYGIKLDGDSLTIGVNGLKTTTVPIKKAAATIGDGSAKDIIINHNLSTEDIIVNVHSTADPKLLGNCDIEIVDENSIKCSFDLAPLQNAYRVVILG